MSLFKLKSLWSDNFPDEEFDERHLQIGKINKKPCLALGSFKGLFRVFLLIKKQKIIVNKVYQNQFEGPIIDVKFVPHPDQKIRGNTIGVLLFRKFAYLAFSFNGDRIEANILTIDVEPSFAIGISPISTITLNSSIQYLNPLQIQKIKTSDPIYPFAQTMNKFYFACGEELVEMQGTTEQWRIMVGRIRQIFIYDDSVIVIGDRALWEVSHAKVIKTKVMEEDISAGAIAFKGNEYNILIANFNHQLFIYSSNYELLWAIKLDSTPIRIFVCEHEEIRGALAILTQEGSLMLSYTGTEMPETMVQPISNQVDMSVVQSETQRYQNQLKVKKESKGGEQKVQKPKGYQSISIKAYCTEIQKTSQPLQFKGKLFQSDGKAIKSCLIVEFSSKQTLINVKIELHLPSNILSDNSEICFNSIRGKQTASFNLYTNNESFPYQTYITVSVRYNVNQEKKGAKVQLEKVKIPMKLQSKIAGFESLSNAVNKIIVKSNIELPKFNDIFPEIFSKGQQDQRKSIEFTISNGVQCGITYNKGFNKAKIESQFYSGLCYILCQFIGHVKQYNRKNGSKIQLLVQIPLQEFFAIMKDHFEFRAKLKQQFQQLQLKTEEFRNCQKKLLIKLKEKVTSVNNIDKLLEYTYEQLIQQATKYENLCQEMDIINHNLQIAIKLIIQMLFIRSNATQNARKIAEGILNYEKQSMDSGWEEKIMLNSAYYLNRKYKKGDTLTFEQLQKIPLYVISKVNNGDWNE